MNKIQDLVVVVLESLEERNVETTEDVVVDFFADYIDSDLIEVEDVVVTESVLDELSDYVESFEDVIEDEDDEDLYVFDDDVDFSELDAEELVEV